jgi:hypothetical protein
LIDAPAQRVAVGRGLERHRTGAVKVDDPLRPRPTGSTALLLYCSPDLAQRPQACYSVVKERLSETVFCFQDISSSYVSPCITMLQVTAIFGMFL